MAVIENKISSAQKNHFRMYSFAEHYILENLESPVLMTLYFLESFRSPSSVFHQATALMIPEFLAGA
jgi:hypothetical protein